MPSASADDLNNEIKTPFVVKILRFFQPGFYFIHIKPAYLYNESKTKLMNRCKLKPSLQKIIFLFILAFFVLFCQQKNILIISSDYEIVINDKANERVKQAAEELQFYLQEIAPVKIPIVSKNAQNEGVKKIFVGELRSVMPESVFIKNEDENLYISGGNPDAVYHACIVFLEEFLGCRWYSPEVEKIPQLKKIKLELPIDYSYTPEITTRTVHSKLYYENHAFADKQKVTYEAFPRYVPSARVHTFHRFMPESKFYKKHPEYYALRGKRRLPTQLCLTNPDVFEIVRDSVKAYFERYPEAEVISVSQDDNTQHCQCDNCRKIDEEEGSPSATMIRFVNEIAAEFPDKQISTLAYQYTRKPCQTKPAKNVLITLCSIECDRSAPIDQKCTDFAEDLIGWKQLTENIRIWDYTTQFTNFLAPFPNLKTLQPNIQFFRDNNAKWVFEQHSHNPSELFELRSYLMAKLLWNPDIDVEATIDDFVNGYYENAGVWVKKYIDQVHQELANNPDFFLYLYGDPSQAFESFLKPKLLVQYNHYFDEAEKAVADTPEILQRVKTARLSIDYASLEAARKNSYPEFQMVSAINGKKEANAETQKRLTNFKETCEKENITYMNEMGYMVDEYCAAYEKTLTRLLTKNIATGKNVTLLTQPKKYAAEDPQVLTDGALGGSSFFANWLGFEGNNMEAVIDLGSLQEIKTVSTGFLQVTNHIVFFPEKVSFYSSADNKNWEKICEVVNPKPLSKQSKVNDIEFFNTEFNPIKTRYVKVCAKNVSVAPVWHHAAGLPVWIFCDEIMVN